MSGGGGSEVFLAGSKRRWSIFCAHLELNAEKPGGSGTRSGYLADLSGKAFHLFFGWSFGLCDLSNDELYAFLNELQIILGSFDPESLRKIPQWVGSPYQDIRANRCGPAKPRPPKVG